MKPSLPSPGHQPGFGLRARLPPAKNPVLRCRWAGIACKGVINPVLVGDAIRDRLSCRGGSGFRATGDGGQRAALQDYHAMVDQ